LYRHAIDGNDVQDLLPHRAAAGIQKLAQWGFEFLLVVLLEMASSVEVFTCRMLEAGMFRLAA